MSWPYLKKKHSFSFFQLLSSSSSSCIDQSTSEYKVKLHTINVFLHLIAYEIALGRGYVALLQVFDSMCYHKCLVKARRLISERR